MLLTFSFLAALSKVYLAASFVHFYELGDP
jgi:hypothetical protein